MQLLVAALVLEAVAAHGGGLVGQLAEGGGARLGGKGDGLGAHEVERGRALADDFGRDTVRHRHPHALLLLVVQDRLLQLAAQGRLRPGRLRPGRRRAARRQLAHRLAERRAAKLLEPAVLLTRCGGGTRPGRPKGGPEARPEARPDAGHGGAARGCEAREERGGGDLGLGAAAPALLLRVVAHQCPELGLSPPRALRQRGKSAARRSGCAGAQWEILIVATNVPQNRGHHRALVLGDAHVPASTGGGPLCERASRAAGSARAGGRAASATGAAAAAYSERHSETPDAVTSTGWAR